MRLSHHPDSTQCTQINGFAHKKFVFRKCIDNFNYNNGSCAAHTIHGAHMCRHKETGPTEIAAVPKKKHKRRCTARERQKKTKIFYYYFEFVEEAHAHDRIDACESLKSFNRTTRHCPVVAALLFYILSRGSVTMYQQRV